MQRVLVIDDDVGLCELVAEYLGSEGYEVEAVHDGETGVERAVSGGHELAVLDVMLPGINGFEVLRRIRARSRLPVVMLTARGLDVDRIVGLELGPTIISRNHSTRANWSRASTPSCGALGPTLRKKRQSARRSRSATWRWTTARAPSGAKGAWWN